MKKDEQVFVRLFENTKVSDSSFYKGEPCIEWTKSLDTHGYGRISYGGKLYGTHVLSWIFYFGEYDKKVFEICHNCDNRKCLNPNHLFLGTHKENMEDMVKKGRSNPRFGENSHLHKLTDEEVEKIREIYSNGEYSQKDIGEMFGVKQRIISYIITGGRRNRKTCDKSNTRDNKIGIL